MPTVPANCSRIGVQWPSGTTVQPPRGEVALPKPAVVHPLTIKSKNGDTLGAIAAKYGVRVKDLQNWNGLRGTNISAGKRLKIYK